MSVASFAARCRALAVVVAFALVAAACATDDDSVADDPGGALRDAIANLADYEGFELVLRMEADDGVLAAAVGDGELSEEEAELLFRSSVTVRTSGEGDDGAVALVVTASDTDVLEVRVLPRMDVYARADLATILELADDPDVTATLEGFVAQAELFGFGDVASAVRAGEWIRLTGIEQMLAMFEAMDPSGPDEDDEDVERLVEEITAAAQRFLAEEVEVTYVGSDDAGERVRATTDGAALQRLAAQIVSIVAAADDLGGLGGEQVLRELERDIPADVELSFDAWISGGELTQVAFDLAAVADEDLGGELSIVIGISEFTAGIDAPADVTEIDVFGLVGGFMGGAFGAPGTDPSDDDLLDDDAPPADDPLGDADLECITEDELDEVEQLIGEDARDEIEQLIDAGILELC